MISIEEAKDLSILTVNEFMGSLQTHEKHLNRSTTYSQEKVFKPQSNARGMGRGKSCGKRSREKSCDNEDSSKQAGLKKTPNKARRTIAQIKGMTREILN